MATIKRKKIMEMSQRNIMNKNTKAMKKKAKSTKAMKKNIMGADMKMDIMKEEEGTIMMNIENKTNQGEGVSPIFMSSSSSSPTTFTVISLARF